MSFWTASTTLGNLTTSGSPPYAKPSSTVGLSQAELAWAGFYAWIGDPILATAVLIFVWHEVRRSRSMSARSKLTQRWALGLDRLLWPLAAVYPHRHSRSLQAVQAPAGEATCRPWRPTSKS
jgi:hypothetical protein